jgi:hypothetical protein
MHTTITATAGMSSLQKLSTVIRAVISKGTGIFISLWFERSKSAIRHTQKSLVEEEVPASHETKGIVDPLSGQTDESTGHGHQDCHLGDTVVDQTQHAGVDGVGDEQAARATLVQSTTDGNEQRGTDGTTNGQELNLSVSKTTLEVVLVLGDDAILDIDWAVGVNLVLVDALLAAELIKDTHLEGMLLYDLPLVRVCGDNGGREKGKDGRTGETVGARMGSYIPLRRNGVAPIDGEATDISPGLALSLCWLSNTRQARIGTKRLTNSRHSLIETRSVARSM